MKLFKFSGAEILRTAIVVVGFSAAGLLTACAKGSDTLRSKIPQTGVAATVQVDLPQTGQTATIAATVYNNGVAQPLVGGDVWQAQTDQSLVTLKAVDNLDGHYSGSLAVDHADTAVDIAVNYDQRASAEDRWFGNDDLLVNPGPGSLVGYGVTDIHFPQEMIMASPLSGAVYRSQFDTIQVNWTPVDEGDQVRLVALMSCKSLGETYKWAYVHAMGIEGRDSSAAGQYEITVGQLLTTAPLDLQLSNIVNYIASFVVVAGFGFSPVEFLGGDGFTSLDDFKNGCDIDITLFRERTNTLPANFSGGYAISSRSATARIKYVSP